MVSSRSLSNENDELNQRLKLFGDIWIVRIITLLANMTQRFNELQRNVGPISPTVLADRLKRLETYGLIVREQQTVDQLSVVYRLTDKGKTIVPLLKSIETFTQKYL